MEVCPHTLLLSGSVILAFGICSCFMLDQGLSLGTRHCLVSHSRDFSGTPCSPSPPPYILRDVSCVSFPGIKLCLPHLVSVLMSMLWFLHRKYPQRRWNLRLQSRDPRPRGFP